MKNDDMGKGRATKGGGSLTEDDMKEMAEKWGITLEETKKNIFETLRGELGVVK
ncbi:MAG: hypothetical protein ACD_50C00333G0020 [uncultured bacterium]|nr:MAG: hypothetical protein ACD_50C00333G0020 [uncultured bacterium]